MSWTCACGIQNGDGRGNCSNCGWTRQKSDEYIRKHPPGSEEPTYKPPPLTPGMKEYKVISVADCIWGSGFSASTLERGLNSLARERWAVTSVVNTMTVGKGLVHGGQEILIVLERTLTEEMLVGRK